MPVFGEEGFPVSNHPFNNHYGKLLNVNDQYVFYPPNRPGVIFHLITIAILTLAGAWGLWQAAHTSVGFIFLLYLAPFLLAVPLVPFLTYRLSNLENANYKLERDCLQLRWGLRVEIIPMVNVQWVRPATDLGGSLRLPRFRWPGAVLGTRRIPGGATVIEFLASQTRDMLVIATPERLFAISPANPNNFLLAYQHYTEMGSLLTLPAQSIHSTVLVTRLWKDRPARYLILSGALLSLGLLIWISLTIPGLEQVSLGITPSGAPRSLTPSIRLMLLPVLNSFTFVVNLLLGMAFFRREETQPLAYLLWITSILVSVLFLTATYFILQII